MSMTSPAGNPWKRLASSDADAVPDRSSLCDVMAQQLAEKIDGDQRTQEEIDLDLAMHLSKQLEESRLDAVVAPHHGDDDYALALRLQEEEQKAADRRASATDGPSSEEGNKKAAVDEDYLLALQLQNEFEAQHFADMTRNDTSLSKVTVSYRNHFADDDEYKRFMYFNGQLDSTCSAQGTVGEVDYDDDYDDNGVEYDMTDDEYGEWGQARGAAPRKPNGRAPAAAAALAPNKRAPYGYDESDGSIITKHDKQMCGRRNADTLLQDGWQGGSTGDFSADIHSGQEVTIPTGAFNKLKETGRRHENRRIRHRGGQNEFTTQEGALDMRTRILLFSMINAEILDEVHGCISTGKESNVYHAAGTTEEGAPAEYAIKVFLTTLNHFKNRRDYINGDFRYRRQQRTQTSKQLVELWTKKEKQNLHRLTKYGVPCPRAIHVQKHVLVLSFIGENGIPAPKLKQAIRTMGLARKRAAYYECVKLIRQIYQKSKLVHADLSEYNLLWYRNRLVVIDVSQSIENDNPNALNYLRRDCIRMTNFFVRNGISNALSSMQLFDFVTSTELGDDDEDAFLGRVASEERKELTEEERVQQAVFENETSFIPRTLWDVGDPHVERRFADDDDLGDVYHQHVMGMTS